MTQTFDIRFARSAGLAAMLEVSENAFRWKGGGLLRIDAQGISIGLKRSLLALFGGNRTQRILAENLRAVYREGDALRVEYQSGESARVVLPFWAKDRDAAAQIVRLLPTSQTVEIEDANNLAKPRTDWRVLLMFGVALAAVAVGMWAVYQRNNLAVAVDPAPISDAAEPIEVPAPPRTPDVAAQNIETSAKPAPSTSSNARRVEAPAFPLNASLPNPATRPAYSEPTEASVPSNPRDSPAVSKSTPSAAASTGEASPPALRVRATAEGLVPIVPGMPAYEAARRQIDLFMAESRTLRGYFEDARYAASSQRFAEIEKLWWKVTVRVSNSPDFEDPALRHLQEIELAVSRAWRRAFAFYGDPSLLVSADAEVDFAEMLEARARQFVK